MPPEAELALLRAAQEALANVARHAGAATVALTLGYLEDEVTLDVCDDGRGFGSAPAAPAPTAGAAGGFGLEAMRERIEGVSGTLRVRSELGAGTTVSARVPHGIAGVGA
ncbi:sensor histidine kinase [Actinacidiphila yeochonensis]|uniref:sensor histidine kinase n=1 Tax=Actinacidiphila yeochonensis TaxID=89050 RepID=UPI000690BA9E|nr:ATP-binding protein [Actinacidiphila yeochonensis]